MSDIHSNEAIERLRQKVKAADDSLHDVLRMVETVSTQQKDINSMNLKLKESDQKIFTLGAKLDESVSARKMQSKEIQILQYKLERSKEECQKLTDLNRAEKAREYEKSLREVEASKDETMKYMKYKDLKIQHLESGAIQHEQKIEMLEHVLENQKSKLNELRMELENSQRNLSITNSYLSQNQREQVKLFGRNNTASMQSERTKSMTEMPAANSNDMTKKHDEKENKKVPGDVEKLESLISTNEPIRPYRKLEKENKELKKEVQEKEGMLAKLKKDMEEKENKITELEEEIYETQERANKNMKHKRLNEVPGRRITDNNPYIADLSDFNRPTKLAEKYAELYDNDWTDAYSYLETLDAYKGSEVTVIAALMTMLTTAYKMSLETAESQLEALHHILGDFRGSMPHQDQQVKDVIKQLKDQRKRAVQPSKDLTEKYRKEIEKAFPRLDSSIFESEALKPYLQKCLELCWLMTIQDPPVHLKCDGCKKGELFDKNMYKEYAQAGLLIAYTVWPPVFLEKDGALLCKGVVQCDKRPSISFFASPRKTLARMSKK